MRFFYSFFVLLGAMLIGAASLFNEKARSWTKGRKNIFKRLEKEIGENEKLIWFHCASLGEFEQGRPVIEAVKSTFSDHKILLTFFSPSGYEIRKDYEGADYVYYLPADTAKNAKKFVTITQPRMVFFIKYEFWFNYIEELSKNKVPFFVVSAIFRPTQHFFKPWGWWLRKHLQKISYYFVQNHESLDLLQQIKVYHAEVSGDTRFDRVIALSREAVSFPLIPAFSEGKQLLIAGSTWPADEDILAALLERSEVEFKLIVAPHQVNEDHISQIFRKFKKFNPQRYSKADQSKFSSSRVLIIDTYGMLAYLFSYAKVAYIGGGFGVGIHNTLEAATYGMPVLFGPNYQRFKEAVELISVGGAYSFDNAEMLQTTFETLMTDDLKYQESARAAGSYVQENAGATLKVIEKAKEYLIAK